MINKYQTGGQISILQEIAKLPQDLQKKIMTAFGKWAQAKGLNMQQLQGNEQALEQAMGQFLQEIQGAQKARLGAKLNYLRSIKGDCPEGQQLVYFKQGGRICKKCVEKGAAGAKAEPKGKDAVNEFKKKKACGGIKAKFQPGGKTSNEVLEQKCGGKAKKHQLGGSLNGIPFMLQGKDLPTAPKAEDRYRNGRRTWNTPFYKEVSSASNIFGDPLASRIAMEVSNNGNDTTFYETPGRWLPVNVKTRTASKKNQNFRTILGPRLSTEESKTIIIDPEYETLKRRFNTAWNLAK